MKKINLLVTTIILFFAISFHSCSTGSDPQPTVNDMFKIPINYALRFANVTNDIAMEVNAIALNHLKTTNNRIKSNVPECLKALVYRNQTSKTLDSIVMDYGDRRICYSNGAEFLGRIVVKSADDNLKKFNVTLKRLKSRYFSISGDFEIIITGNKGGDDFTISSANLKYVITDKTTDKVTEFPISNYKSTYKFIRSEEEDRDYIDDVFTFTSSFDGVMPDGATYAFSTEEDLKYTYRCKNILGGKAAIELSDLGKAIADFGGGDVDRDCNKNVSISVEGIEYSIDL